VSFFANVVDGILEASVAGSFSGIGCRARRSLGDWEVLPANCMAGKVVVISGGTSGLGEVASEALLRLGAHVTMLARNKAKAEQVCARIRASIGATEGTLGYVYAEMGDLTSVKEAALALRAKHPRIDVLIHNAGALDAAYSQSRDGIEQTVASHVVGPFLLTDLLLPALAAATGSSDGARVLFVSSGGMYSEPLEVSSLEMAPASYDGVKAYAKAKRVQVTLCEMMATRFADRGIRVHAMHPGWADTPGVARSLPTFRKIALPFLRTPEEGADTLVWLAASMLEPHAPSASGTFWLDRAPRTLHKLSSTRKSDTPEARETLWSWLLQKTEPFRADFA
jgi:dehydrogenase/reductase SDR family member 12